ncbi:hypothetical protein BU25DRAFT_134861 [Macroventuria anomochaeta]|uniref:Uncharacterized protein n=1 Tax=Macroventuria anomochaeta TaxID=301207 RepID=A0ACB6RUK7_9PLEO|nr:uncharacterized protein BU25DRAFT_134861 [Macroventuria anomochaeta]KAF2624824.1 hypothetical protein BU25DRAFT_134861 [Macroventuria anomochaeta]
MGLCIVTVCLPYSCQTLPAKAAAYDRQCHLVDTCTTSLACQQQHLVICFAFGFNENSRSLQRLGSCNKEQGCRWLQEQSYLQNWSLRTDYVSAGHGSRALIAVLVCISLGW